MTCHQVAELLGCGPQKVRDEARRLRIGYNLGGSAGWRFTRADVVAFRKALSAPPAPPRRRRRR